MYSDIRVPKSPYVSRVYPEVGVLDGFPYWTQLRRELFQWLKDRAPSLAEPYVAAICLLHTPAFPARVHLVCHLVRDIYTRLPAAMGMEALSRPGEVYRDALNSLIKAWDEPNSEFLEELEESEDVDLDVPVSVQVYHCIRRLIEIHSRILKQPSIARHLTVALFRSVDRQKDAFIDPWIIKSFKAEYDFFVGRAHLTEALDKVPSDEGLMEHFEAFERAFHSLVGSCFTGKEELDAILQDTNKTAD